MRADNASTWSERKGRMGVRKRVARYAAVVVAMAVVVAAAEFAVVALTELVVAAVPVMTVQLGSADVQPLEVRYFEVAGITVDRRFVVAPSWCVAIVVEDDDKVVVEVEESVADAVG